MNEPRFEVFPETQWVRVNGEEGGSGRRQVPTGEFCWHFKAANGRITFTGGESFGDRRGAHQSISGVVGDVLGVWGITNAHPTSLIPSRLRIVDLIG